MLLNFFLIPVVESLIFIGAGAEAGEKNTQSRSWSKMDMLRNTAHSFEWPFLLKLLCKKIVRKCVSLVQSIVFQHMFLNL